MGLRVRLLVLLHFARRLGPPVFAVLAYVALATAVVRWDMTRNGEVPRAFDEELYGMFMQLMFEPIEELPQAPIARVVFWLTPIVGVVLLAEGLAKVGSSLLDPVERRSLFTRIRIESMKDHVVVCGLGHVGYRVVQALRALGQPVVAIERSTESFVEVVRADDVPVLVGDAKRDDILMQAGIAKARAVVCATNDDLANLEVALDAKRMNPKIRVVLRMFDQRMANKVGGALELDQTFSTSALAAPLVALQATQTGIRSVYMLDGQVRVVAEVVLTGTSDKRSVADLEDKLDARVVSIQKVDETTFARPRGFDQVSAGDVIVVDALADRLEQLRGRA